MAHVIGEQNRAAKAKQSIWSNQRADRNGEENDPNQDAIRKKCKSSRMVDGQAGLFTHPGIDAVDLLA